MNIWLFTPVLDRYGASSTVIAIAKNAAEKNNTVTIIAPENYLDHSVLLEIESTNQICVKILDIPIFRRGIMYNLKNLISFIFTYSFKMRRIKKELDAMPRPDIMHFATLATLTLTGISYRGTVKQLSIHEITRNSFEKKILQKICERNIDCINFCSSYVRENYEDLSGPVIYSGVDVSKFWPSSVLSINPNKAIRIACVGRLNSWKGQDLLLESLSILRKSDLKFSCDFYGSTLLGEEFQLERLLELSRTYGLSEDVHFLGEVANIHEYLWNYEILIVPSIIPEPFGKIVVEGMAAKCLLIVSNEGGPREVITHLYSGLLFEARNPNSLAQNISWALENSDLMQELRLNGFKESVAFSIDLTSQQYLDLWTALVKLH
jgi:glycosyltransferase involved in cell wall biosynthesis